MQALYVQRYAWIKVCNMASTARPSKATGKHFVRGAPIDHDVAVGHFTAIGLELIDAYGMRKGKKSGASTYPLKARCAHCGMEGTRTLQQITYHGMTCVRLPSHNANITGCVLKGCFDEFIAYGLEPVDWSKFKSTKTSIDCRCLTCDTVGRITLNAIRNSTTGKQYRHPCFKGSPCDQAREKHSCPEGCKCGRHVGWRLKSQEQAIAEMRAKGFEPLEPYVSTGADWKCRHSCGEVVYTTHHNVHVKPATQKCRICRKVSPEEIEAILDSKQLKVIDRSQLENGLTGRLDLIHIPCGEPVRTRAVNLTSTGNRKGTGGCLHCGLIKQGLENRIPVAQWHALAKKANVTLLDEPDGTKKPVRIRCNRCGDENLKVHYSTLKRGGGCGSCNISAVRMGKATHGCGGFKKNRQALLYLLSDREGSLKVGITGMKHSYNRLQHHRQHGWDVVHTVEKRSGYAIARWEQEVLSWWRNELLAPMTKTAEEMPQGGFTETASIRKVGMRNTINYIESLVTA